MKRLYLLRHAKSSWKHPGLDDVERPLKRRGIEACALLAAYMRRQRIVPDLVLCSPARRARDTLELVWRHLGVEFAVEFDASLYMASADEILAVVRGTDRGVGSLMVVGHNPGLADLARRLGREGETAGVLSLRRKVPTAALASLELACDNWADAGPEQARLAAFVTPGELA